MADRGHEGSTRPGPVALAGSGEFLPVMEPVDRALLQGRPSRAAFLPTAAALEGDERTDYWLDLGSRHYAGMGVEPVPVAVRTRADADDPALATLLSDVGLVYLSGGDPHYLADTLRGTAVWAAVVQAWLAGAALCGCSAGAMALTAGAPLVLAQHLRGSAPASTGGAHADAEPAPPASGPNGLGVIGGVAVVPHFDMIDRWRPRAVEAFVSWRPAGSVLLGIDEDTALVGDDSGWRVEGTGAVWVFEAEGRRRVGPGEQLELPTATLAGAPSE